LRGNVSIKFAWKQNPTAGAFQYLRLFLTFQGPASYPRTILAPHFGHFVDAHGMPAL